MERMQVVRLVRGVTMTITDRKKRREEQTMSDWIVGIIVCVIFIAFMFPITAMFLEDTETFKAIDERIAKLIRGERDRR